MYEAHRRLMTPEVEFVRRERAMVASLVDSLLLLPCFGVAVVDLGRSVVVVAVVGTKSSDGGDVGVLVAVGPSSC